MAARRQRRRTTHAAQHTESRMLPIETAAAPSKRRAGVKSRQTQHKKHKEIAKKKDASSKSADARNTHSKQKRGAAALKDRCNPPCCRQSRTRQGHTPVPASHWTPCCPRCTRRSAAVRTSGRRGSCRVGRNAGSSSACARAETMAARVNCMLKALMHSTHAHRMRRAS